MWSSQPRCNEATPYDWVAGYHKAVDSALNGVAKTCFVGLQDRSNPLSCVPRQLGGEMDVFHLVPQRRRGDCLIDRRVKALS
jgi:hypothetical protein